MTRREEVGSFKTTDDTALSYRRWPVEGRRAGAVVLFHRGHEHGGRMAHLVDELNLPEFEFYAWDARGHGQSEGQRGYSPGMMQSVRDVQAFIQHVSTRWKIPEEDIAVVAQSVGAVLVSTWAHDYAPQVRCLVLASPAFSIKLYVPFARTSLKLLRWLGGDFFINSYVKSRLLTHDGARQRSYDSDPLITRAISVGFLFAVEDVSKRIVADANAITIPTQLLISADDWVVRRRPQERFFDRLGSTIKEKHLLAGFRHDTLGESERGRAIVLARKFILGAFAEPYLRPNLRDAQEQGATAEEARSLARPLRPFSLAGLKWMLVRRAIRFAALFSTGIAVGHRTGFDSGSTLDYVYQNTARGRTSLGRLLDRQFLNALGWRGIRQRRAHIEELLLAALESLKAEGRPLRILDVAAGHGRYVLEAISKGPRPESIHLRDFSTLNVTQGKALIEANRLTDIARFEHGDAFNAESLAMVKPAPTVVIVSGLYELFSDNELVGRSLQGVAEAVEPGGYIIYTGQPWHPQLELIARALTSHRNGQSWVMRRRVQEEMDQLVDLAGFTKMEQRIDEHGIFTVSLARRRAL